MRFREGDQVEVLRTNGEPYGSWFPAKVLSAHINKYTVRYELYVTDKGKPIIERVHEKDVRPRPPDSPAKAHWIVGDIAEVFDTHSWRVGKIAKILNNDYAVTKIFGSIQLKEFHISNLRVRQAWQNNQWVMINKVNCEKQLQYGNMPCSSKYPVQLEDGIHRDIHQETYAARKFSGDHFSCIPPRRTLKRELKAQSVAFPDDEMRGSGRKRKASSKADVCDLLNERALQRKGAAVTFSKVSALENCLPKPTKDRITMYTQMEADKTSYEHARNSRDADECSVASCSGNDILENANRRTRRRTRKHSAGAARKSFDDAMSSSPNAGGEEYQGVFGSGEKLAASIHELELHAYQSTMQALYASGPLSWEQESLLTDLRLSLNISNEEHSLHLRQLLSAEVL